MDSECTVVDTITRDSDEYDTEWSSQELLLFIPRLWQSRTHTAHCCANVQRAVLTCLLCNERMPEPMYFDTLEIIFQFMVGVKYVPAQRLHRYAVMGPQFGWGRALAPPAESRPSPEQQAVLDATTTLVGMGRVNQWTDAGDGEDPCLAAEDEKLDSVSEDCDYKIHLPYLHPVYFNWSARNIKGILEGGDHVSNH